MTESTAKKPVEVTHHPVVGEYDNKASYIYAVKHPNFKDAKGGVKEAFDIALPIPKDLAAFNKRYSPTKECTFAEVIRYAIQNFGTRPNWLAGEVDEKTGELKEGAHTRMQAIADNFTIDTVRKAGGAARVVKEKATRLDSIEEKAKKAGFDSLEAYIAHLVSKKK